MIIISDTPILYGNYKYLSKFIKYVESFNNIAKKSVIVRFRSGKNCSSIITTPKVDTIIIEKKLLNNWTKLQFTFLHELAHHLDPSMNGPSIKTEKYAHRWVIAYAKKHGLKKLEKEYISFLKEMVGTLRGTTMHCRAAKEILVDLK